MKTQLERTIECLEGLVPMARAHLNRCIAADAHGYDGSAPEGIQRAEDRMQQADSLLTELKETQKRTMEQMARFLSLHPRDGN